MDTSQLLLVVVPFVFVTLGGCYGFFSQRKRSVNSQLAAPLLLDGAGSSADARVESAVRAAQEGFRVCAKCEFENLHRSAFCAICSAALANGNKKSHSLPLTDRQQRVRQRKRWVRRVNELGNVYWHHTAEDKPVPKSCVLHMRAAGETEPATKPTVVDEEPLREQGGPHVAIQVHVDEVDRDSSRPCLHGQQEVVAFGAGESVVQFTTTVENAADVDAAVPTLVLVAHDATSSTATTRDDDEKEEQNKRAIQEIRDTVAQSQLDFPTKLAQFITASSSLFLDASSNGENGIVRSTHFTIDRTKVLSNSVKALVAMTATEARGAIRVSFEGEQGIDAGGVYREWFVLLGEQIITPEAGIFTCVDPHDQVFYLNPHSREIVLGLPVGFDDLEYFDPDVYKSLKWLLENDGADALCLNFTVVEKLPNGTTRVVELVAGGSEMDVNDGNKHDFVDRKLKYLLFESVSSQLFAFLKGLYEVVPAELLMLFDAEELDYVLAGSDEIDVDDWERHTKYTEDLEAHPARKHFWKLVREMTIEQRRNLLQFATGSSRVPPAGFAALSSYDGRLCPFTLVGVGGWRDGGYVRSHSCFNRLDLPRHQTKKGLQMALAAAIESDAMGFTMQ